MNNSPVWRVLRTILTYIGIIGVTLLAVDAVCISFGLFPPRVNNGDPDLGWRPANATGRREFGRCVDVSSGATVDYYRNEDGVRTNLSRDALVIDTVTVKIAVSGDSQTELCAPNAQVHFGVLESALSANGIRSTVLPYGAGKYSPLQAYLAYRKVLRPYGPRVFVLNFYTGNDFYDILRIDDRPHFVADRSQYRIAAPVWYSLDDPNARHRSRVLFVARTLAERIGVRRVYLRVSELRRTAAQQNAGLSAVWSYMVDLWKAREHSVGYPDAFTSQMLNQQLFFYHFPASKHESIRRVRELLTLIRKENPGVVLVMSPLPSYQLSARPPVDSALLKTLRRIPVSFEDGVRQEAELYEQLRQIAAEHKWLFVDNLAALKQYSGNQRLYNDFDYHLLPPASNIIGKAQADALLRASDIITRQQHGLIATH